MKKFTTKLFALLLAALMFASLIPFAALAEGEEEIIPSAEIQEEFSEGNGYTVYSNWGNEHHVIEDNFCGIPGVSAVCDIFAYYKSTAVYVCDITITIGETVNADLLVISDILSIIGDGIVTMPSNYIRFNIHIVDNSGNNYRYLPDSLDMSTPAYEFDDYSEYGYSGTNNRGKLTWNPTFADLGFSSCSSLDNEDEYFSFASALKNRYPVQCSDINLTNSEGENDYDACNEVLARVLDDYYIEYFNQSRDESNQIASLADLTLEEVAIVAMPGQAPQIVPKSKILNEEISEHIYWRYFYEHCLSAGDGTLVPHVPADQQYENVYHDYADKTGEKYAYMQQLFADGIKDHTTIKFGVQIDGADTQNAYQSYLFPIPIPASFTLAKPLEEKEPWPGLEKWILTDFYEIIDVDPEVQVTVVEGNVYDLNGNLMAPPTVPEGREVVGPIIEERYNEETGENETWLTGWNIHVTKVELDTIGAGDTVNFLLESNLGEDFLNVFPPNYPLNDSHTPPDQNWEVSDFGEYVFTFHDVMAPELVLNENSFVVKVGDYALQPGEYQLLKKPAENTEPVEGQNPTDGCTFEIVIDSLVQLFLDGRFQFEQIGVLPITVEYNATAIDDLPAGEYHNRAWVTANEYTTPSDDVEVRTYGIDIYKYAQGEHDHALSGAVFELYKAVWNEETQKWIQGERVAVGTTDENGHLRFEGLDVGHYFIVETEAPEGYVCDRNPKLIEITADNVNNYLYSYEVPNVEVPHTGGTGTVIFSVIGACMLVCAGAMYIIYRKRLKTEA